MKKAQTRISIVMDEIQNKITSRVYLPSTKLPSVRAQARMLSVSVSTVVEAYERLMAEGIIISRPGSGFYVSGPISPLALTQMGPKLDREVDPLWVSRQALDTNTATLKPGCGWLPATWLYETGMRKALRSMSRNESLELVEYATSLGHPELRQLLSRRLNSHRIEVDPNQIMLTESGTQAIDLICRFFLAPGDTVIVDDPCYFNFHALLKAHRVNIVSVPYTVNGPDLEIFKTVLDEYTPRLYITNSAIHNPTGATLSPVTAHRLLKLIDHTNLIIVEDDIFADFELTAAPRLASFDGLNRVIQIGSFSKTISASVRCGYIAARTDWVEDLVDLKIATSFGGGRFAAELILHVLKDSGYRKHMEVVRTRLANEMVKTAAKLEALGIKPWITPQAGMFLWCKLPQGLDAGHIAQACLKHGVVLAPGNAFSQSLTAKDFLRFNVAQSTDDHIFEVLAEVIAQHIN